MKDAWDNYEAKTGNTLDIQVVPIDTGASMMKMKFATGDIPDIFMHFGGYALTAYQPEENFVDFTDAFWVSDLQDYVLAQAQFNDRIYGLPHWEASVSGLLYNKEIFDRLGLRVPDTQEDFEAACDAIAAAGITPIYLAFRDVWPLLYQFGINPLVSDTSVLEQLNSNQLTYETLPGFRNLVSWYKTLVDREYLGSRFTTNTWDGAPEALASGEFAMMYAWDSWIYSDLEPSYPGMAEKFGIMPAFKGSTPRGAFEGPNVCLTMVNKNGSNVDAAIEFINFLASPENYNVAFDGFSTAPVFIGQTTNEATSLYVEAQEVIAEKGYSSIAMPFIVGFTQVDGARFLQDLMLGNIDVDECIRLMDRDRIEIARAQQVPGF
jgi:raffinose/stachyose/melibiose transport system substrate-binding protein